MPPSEVLEPAAGWSTGDAIAGLVRDRGLPAITRDYLLTAFSPAEWDKAEIGARALGERFRSARVR